MAHYLVDVHVLINGACRQMRFTVDSGSAEQALDQAERDVETNVEGAELVIADRAVRLRDLAYAA